MQFLTHRQPHRAPNQYIQASCTSGKNIPQCRKSTLVRGRKSEPPQAAPPAPASDASFHLSCFTSAHQKAEGTQPTERLTEQGRQRALLPLILPRLSYLEGNPPVVFLKNKKIKKKQTHNTPLFLFPGGITYQRAHF